MKDFTIDDMVRYLITGIWVFFIVNQQNILPNMMKFDKEFNVIVISFSIGVVAYFMSRTFLYPILQWVLDKCILSPHTGRNYLKQQFGIKDWGTRNDLWVLFHQTYSTKYPGHYTIWLSSFLTMYTLAISTPVTIILSLLLSTHCIHHVLIYIACFIVIFLAGIISNVNYENRMFNNTIMISDPTLKEFVQDYLAKKSKLSQRREGQW